MWDPSAEGKTHINAYSKSKTEAGRLLSNFAVSPFTCEDGAFRSIEGYWYWLAASHRPEERERLRELSGFAAKQYGREIRAPDWPKSKDFEAKITRALTAKVEQNPHIKAALLSTDELPIVHYYTYGPKVIVLHDGLWLWNHLMHLRKELKS